METFYTKKEYNEMRSVLNRKLAAAEKKIAKLEETIKKLKAED